ncbi:hypothetical protein R5R35_014300 [Gryllus longicercus]|uniref:Uncharacterized protein n=1 Tax=Gryllus longicercus TaxID=2509291 RepID=A0AAN9V4D3_9ORTH
MTLKVSKEAALRVQETNNDIELNFENIFKLLCSSLHYSNIPFPSKSQRECQVVICIQTISGAEVIVLIIKCNLYNILINYNQIAAVIKLSTKVNIELLLQSDKPLIVLHPTKG